MSGDQAQLSAARPGQQHPARGIGPGYLAEPLTGREPAALRLLAAGRSSLGRKVRKG